MSGGFEEGCGPQDTIRKDPLKRILFWGGGLQDTITKDPLKRMLFWGGSAPTAGPLQKGLEY